MHGGIITLHLCTTYKWQSWCIFCPFTISSFYTSVTKTIIIDYTLPETWDMTDEIVIFHFGLFFALLPPSPPPRPNSQKNEGFKKIFKTPQDIIILHRCTKTHDHILYCSWDIVRDGCNCYFSYWAIFRPFTPYPLTARKI